MKKISLTIMLIFSVTDALSQEQKQIVPLACEKNSDCRLVTSYKPPAGEGRPGETLIKCSPTAEAVKEGEWLTEYNDYTKSTCICLETKTCGFKR